MLHIHRKTSKILCCFLTNPIFSFFPAPMVKQWVKQGTSQSHAVLCGLALISKQKEGNLELTLLFKRDSLLLPWYQLSITTASRVAYWKNSASQNPNPQKQFPSSLPFFTIKPLGTAVINRQPPSVALVVTCSKRSGSIAGHSCFALAIKLKVSSFKRTQWGSAIHTRTFRWCASLPSAPK